MFIGHVGEIILVKCSEFSSHKLKQFGMAALIEYLVLIIYLRLMERF